MKKRDTERYTEFSRKIKEECNLQDLQGICSNWDGTYTIAVEAVDMENDPVEDYVKLFNIETMCAKSRFAESLGAYLSLLLHKKEKDEDKIYVKTFSLNADHQSLHLTYDKALSEQNFIDWWKKRQPRVQKKKYRESMQQILAESYFDKLFEKNQTSWSGNIDAFTTERDEQGKIQITSLIECRYTSKGSVSCYDPNDYYKNNGGDFCTWNGLWRIKRKLDIPLYLITFSRDMKFREELGVTEIIDFNGENGVIYKESVKPGMRVMHSSAELLEWMRLQR